MVSKTQFVKKNEGPPLVFQCKTKRNRKSTKVKCSKTKQRMENYCLIIILNLASSLKKHATISTSPFPMGGIPMFRSVIYKDHFRTKILQLHSPKTSISPENWWLNPWNFGKKAYFQELPHHFCYPFLYIFKLHQFSRNSPFQSSISVLALLMGNIPHSCGTYEIWNIHINCIKLCICLIYNIIFILVFSIMSIMLEVPNNPTQRHTKMP